MPRPPSYIDQQRRADEARNAARRERRAAQRGATRPSLYEWPYVAHDPFTAAPAETRSEPPYEADPPAEPAVPPGGHVTPARGTIWTTHNPTSPWYAFDWREVGIATHPEMPRDRRHLDWFQILERPADWPDCLPWLRSREFIHRGQPDGQHAVLEGWINPPQTPSRGPTSYYVTIPEPCTCTPRTGESNVPQSRR